MTLKKFVSEMAIKCQYLKTQENPNMEDGGRGMNNYFIVLTSPHAPGKSMGLFFSMGIGLDRPPRAIDVLECLKSDMHIPDTFKDFCGEFGYNEDSIKALKTFEACQKQTTDLRAWLGKNLFETLEGVDLDY